ncbi:MAG TPA: hypothetical protein H9913_06990 [Candidatus Blautia stercoripullorum]|uniref:Uncharacterized protein n=1 Tax=Candidatus Blautia stercoripullorum TaxID=2838502 RepID=A0A9D2R738_9FIRM|nr:hypothetical protein [Candidatus Blautia stercoripullorum]
MKKHVMAFLMCMVLSFSLTSCTGCGDDETAREDVQASSQEEEQEEEPAGEEAQENDTSAQDSQQETETSDTGEEAEESTEENSESSSDGGAASETGDFQGLEVQNEIEIELEEGQGVAGG